jgi:chemotaxis protein histidine kinase CheA
LAANDADLLAAVMHAGLSTREKVSTTSGRGVGLTAVAEAVRALGGTIDVESQTGRGTVWRVRVPKLNERLKTAAGQTG